MTNDLRSDFVIVPSHAVDMKFSSGKKWNPHKPKARKMAGRVFVRKWTRSAADFPMKHGCYFPPMLGRTYCLI